MWASVCHSQKKHYGYANLAKNPGSGERLSKTIIIFIFTALFALAKGCRMGEAHCAGVNLPAVCAVDKADFNSRNALNECKVIEHAIILHSCTTGDARKA